MRPLKGKERLGVMGREGGGVGRGERDVTLGKMRIIMRRWTPKQSPTNLPCSCVGIDCFVGVSK